MTLVAFEGVAVATVMPAVGRDLDGIGVYAWAFNAYVVASLVGMVTAGTWCDRHGPRLPLQLGALIFGGGALMAGFAPTMGFLIAARGVQGLGGGAIVVAIYVLIARAYEEDLRPRAFSLLAAAWVLPSLIGPLVAGWIATVLTWRWAFWLVPVVMLLPLIALRRVLAAHDGGTGESGRSGRVIPALAAAVGLTLAQVGLLRPDPVPSVIAVAALVVGLALLVVATSRLLPPGSLRLARGLPTTVVMRGLLAGCFFSAEAFLPLALVEERGLSLTMAGFTLAVSSVGWVAGSCLQSRLPGDRDRAGAVQIGSALAALSLATLPLSLLPGITPYAALVSWLVGSLGMGLCFPSIAVQTMRLSPVQEQGINASALQISDGILVALGLGLTGAIHAAAVATGGATTATYTLIWWLGAVGLLAAVGVASRMRVPLGARA